MPISGHILPTQIKKDCPSTADSQESQISHHCGDNSDKTDNSDFILISFHFDSEFAAGSYGGIREAQEKYDPQNSLRKKQQITLYSPSLDMQSHKTADQKEVQSEKDASKIYSPGQ